MARGQNYAVFDLNINIREMRDGHIARMTTPPDVVVLGASHWQEAPSNLVKHKTFYNSHVHRDYYEDMLGVTEMWVRHNKLPKQMIIAIRDNLFTPVEARTDHLWLPIVPYYRAMAARLGLEPHEAIRTLPIKRWREMLSISMLHTNAVRWYGADNRPHATTLDRLEDLDVLLPGGSIHWAGKHQRLYTAARSDKLAMEFAEARRNNPPKIDPVGVAKLKALLTFLRSRDVEVFLAHPPFNPVFFDLVEGTPYRAGLARIEQLTRDLASAYGLEVIGSFDPATLGCTKDMFIDAEHANATCLGKLMDQYIALDRRHEQPVPKDDPAPKDGRIATFVAPPEQPRARAGGTTSTLKRAPIGEAASRMAAAAAPKVTTAGHVASARAGIVDAGRPSAEGARGLDASALPRPQVPAPNERPSVARSPNRETRTAAVSVPRDKPAPVVKAPVVKPPVRSAQPKSTVSARSRAAGVRHAKRPRVVVARRTGKRAIAGPRRVGSPIVRTASAYVPRRARSPFPAPNH
jgi:hypothetical protein